ncbi:MAG: phytanoyl-CoA dioxygenase family protein [Paracoccaceae bacterium]
MTTTTAAAATFQAEGVAMIPGLFAAHVGALRAGVARNLAEPGPYAAENTRQGDTGRFFDDYCNWTRIPEFHAAIHDPAVLSTAAALMRSETVRMFHDHVLVKDGGTSRPTPWHQDGPYYFVSGRQNVSFWVPLDPVAGTGLRCVAGSHLWSRQVMPTSWADDSSFYPDPAAWMPVPDPDAEGMTVREWEMEPGDAVAFHFDTLHGARANPAPGTRRAFSLRLLGDDARYTERPGRTSPPFPGHGMTPGQRLRDDWFPILHP